MTRLFEPADQGAPRLFATSLGVDFCAALIEGLDARLAGQPPEAIARVEILVANARMLRRLQALYLQRGPGFLPRLRTVAGMSDLSDLAGLDAAMPPLRLRLKLADLVRRLIDGDPELAPRAAIYPLADSLADLMGEMFEERVTPEAIAGLDMGAQSGHWARSQAVLGVVETFFGEDAAMTAEARQARLVDRLTRQWREAPPDHPVLIAGSTGSRGATLRLMDAVSRLPQGAVLLPGLDRDMPDQVWTQLTEGRRRPGLGGEDHPQYRLARVAAMAGVAPGSIPEWAPVACSGQRGPQPPRVTGPASRARHRPVARGGSEAARAGRGIAPCHLSGGPQPSDRGDGDRACPQRCRGKARARRAGQPGPEPYPAGRRRARPLEHHA
jgi:ATP-dependent helicase/nuclease subunit B